MTLLCTLLAIGVKGRTDEGNMTLGPNMRRVMDSALAESVVTCITAGPGDTTVWEVRAALSDDGDGIPLEVIGRGTDMEAAAAELWRVASGYSSQVLMQA